MGLKQKGKIMRKLIIKIFTISSIYILTHFASFAETFVYSGGCFWCTEADMEKLSGVIEVTSGFTAGTIKNPKYIPGQWGDHREAALVEYDPKRTRRTEENERRQTRNT